MCGIAGFIDKKNKFSAAEKNKLAEKMIKTMRHRGRDDEGFYVKGKVCLAHARLSILDLSPAGHQPFFSADKKIALTFNGEIYNFLELNKELEKNYKFKTACDTETLMNAYREWGTDALNRLKGMWALAVYDRNQNVLDLAIDRFGIKPLYYFNDENIFAFASEIKTLLCIPSVKACLNKKYLSEYLLYRYITGEQTLFKGIRQFNPGQRIRYDLKTGALKSRLYYEPKKIKLPRNEHDLKKEFLGIINKSVSQHLLSDAPLGLQLSGGVDSSLIAALSSGQKKKNFHSFSIGLKRPGWNEFKYSRLVAKKLKTIHHELYFTEQDFCELLPKLTYQMDEPINHLHSVPMYILSRAARKHVKVLMSGEGADEIFFGYKRYKKIAAKRKINEQELIDLARFGDSAALRKITKADFSKANERRSKIIKNIQGNYEKLFKLEMLAYLVPMLLRQDKMGMAANIENRVPYLDHKLVEFAYSLPPALKLTKNEAKIFLKKIALNFLPREIAYRPKIGFGLPQSDWLRNKKGLGRYLRFFTDQIVTPRDFINYPELQKIIKEHQTKTADHGQLLWIFISLEIWLRIFIDGRDYKKIWKDFK